MICRYGQEDVVGEEPMIRDGALPSERECTACGKSRKRRDQFCPCLFEALAADLVKSVKLVQQTEDLEAWWDDLHFHLGVRQYISRYDQTEGQDFVTTMMCYK